MKKYVCLIGIIALIITSIFSSCKKYEEDYGIMWKSPKGRLVGTWKVSQIDSDTTIKMSDYAMFGELQVIFEKDETGSMKFKDNGLGEMLANINWEEMMAEIENDSTYAEYAGEVNVAMGNMDFAAILSTETKFKWAFDDKKEYLKFDLYDQESGKYVHATDMKILSLCKSDCKLRYEDDSTRMDVSMRK
ncbi:MAG: hypothetical protein J6S84_08405 [Bacteroidales bacterium]|nr:hypothetical protein [Bacteroidales bacterium]